MLQMGQSKIKKCNKLRGETSLVASSSRRLKASEPFSSILPRKENSSTSFFVNFRSFFSSLQSFVQARVESSGVVEFVGAKLGGGEWGYFKYLCIAARSASQSPRDIEVYMGGILVCSPSSSQLLSPSSPNFLFFLLSSFSFSGLKGKSHFFKVS